MRYGMLAALFALLSFGLPQNARAVAMDDYPPGTYQQSCKNISLRGDYLRARCRDVRGHYHDSFLDGADRCWGDIANSDGQLVCNKNGTLPVGGYSQTCRDIRVRYNVLRAKCQTRDGGWADAALESFALCNGVIQNIDGQLRCVVPRRDHDDDRDHDRDRDRDRDGDRDRDRDRDAYRDRDGDRDRVPRGSYAETCRDIRPFGNSLRAVCQDVRGAWVETSINDLDRCAGEIVNDDGRLDCTRRGGRLVPVGSYSQTCRNIYVRGDNLRAMCQSADGRWVWSELHDWDDCRGGVQNINGNLRCVR